MPPHNNKAANTNTVILTVLTVIAIPFFGWMAAETITNGKLLATVAQKVDDQGESIKALWQKVNDPPVVAAVASKPNPQSNKQ